MTAATALLLTRQERLHEEILRLAAAAGVVIDVVHDVPSALRSWTGAPVILVGPDLVGDLAATRPVRRDQVHVVSSQPSPDALFRDAVDLGATSVAELPHADSWLVELMSDIADGAATAAVTVSVVGGCGGAGATTFAAALARTAASPSRFVVLVDADPLGAGIDRVAGLDDVQGARWESLTQSRGRFSSRSLREALPRRGGLGVLTWGVGERDPLTVPTVREVISAAARGSDLVVVDVPRYLDPVGRELLSRSDHVVLVTGLSTSAATASGRVATLLAECGRPTHLLVRGAAKTLQPEEVAGTLGIRLAAAMADQRRVWEWVELGLGPVHSRRGPLARAARTVLAQIGAG